MYKFCSYQVIPDYLEDILKEAPGQKLTFGSIVKAAIERWPQIFPLNRSLKLKVSDALSSRPGKFFFTAGEWCLLVRYLSNL
jgi:hypothetical protein